MLQEEGPFDYVSSSNLQLTGHPIPPRALTVEGMCMVTCFSADAYSGSAEIKEYIDLFVNAAKNAIRAGFDGVEVHAANGYLVDQFIQDTCNNRTDAYGGSVENRARFVLELLDGLCNAVGESKVAIRFSPWTEFQGIVAAIQVVARILTCLRGLQTCAWRIPSRLLRTSSARSQGAIRLSRTCM